MKRPFPAYKGSEPYVFVSYSHRDSGAVFKELQWLRDQGFNIWYDEGIEVGREWREEIANAISGAAVTIYYVTPDSVESENCRNEINFASDEQVPILSVYLKATQLPGGLRLTLSNRQAISRFELSNAEYAKKLTNSLSEYTGKVPQNIQVAPTQSKTRHIASILILLAVICMAGYWWYEPDSGAVSESVVLPEARLRSIAVLPFQNLAPGKHADAISDGIALDLVNGLSKIHDIRVAAATSSFAFKNQYSDVSEIGKRLKVDTVLEGSVRIIDGKARVNAQLLLVEDGYQLWSESYDRPFEDVLSLQDEITGEILNSVRLHLIDEAEVEQGKVSLGAYNLYLVARDNMRARTEDSLKVAREQFEESLALDPEFGPAWADLARTIILLSDLQYGETPFIEAKLEAEQKLETAFQLDANLASAYATQGFLRLNESNQMEALSSFHRAIANDPNNAYAHFMKSEILAENGNFGEALESLELAYELDARHPVIQYRLVTYYLSLRNYEGVRDSVRPDQKLLADALIDFNEGQYASGVTKATEYLKLEEAGFAGVHLRLELARRHYFRLKNIDLAQQVISESNAFAGRIYFQALEYPEVAFQLLRQIPEDYQNRFSKFLLSRSQIVTGRYEACLATLGYTDVSSIPIHGRILGLPGSELSLAYHAAFALKKLGRRDEAEALQKQLMRHHILAIEQGEPPIYFRHLARLEMLVDNHDEAVKWLALAHENYAIDWLDLENPWYDELRDRQDFTAIVNELYQHLNEQRRKLGWDPVSH